MSDSIPAWLDSAEIARFEEAICTELRRFISFDSHALYFSQINAPDLILDERRLLLPIRLNGAQVATLRLDEVDSAQIAIFLQLLPDIAQLCLEKIIVVSGRDFQTGLESEETLVSEFERRISFARAGDGYASCLGLIVIDLPDTGSATGPVFRQAITTALPRIVECLRKNIPEGAIVGRLEKMSRNFVFALLVPSSSRVFCQKLARKLVLALEKIRIHDPLSDTDLPFQVCAGHSLFPHDLSGRELKLPNFEQALLIRDRARLAATAAWNADHLAIPITAWSWIPMLCCTIQEMLSTRLARLNHGMAAGIRENQRFLVIPRGKAWEAANARAQIVIRKARESESLAEIICAATASGQPEPGDGVILIREIPKPEPGPGFESQGSFMARFKARTDARFVLVVSRLKTGGRHDHGLREIYARRLPEKAFAGGYGADGIITYWAGAEAEEAERFLVGLHEDAAAAGLELASGIFAYPCLNFGRDESEACVLKALAYAELLPAPHIGFLDAYALAISADKRFSKGDETGALEEYRQALLLKPADAMLLNSLGVCLAALNRNGEARRSFEQSLKACVEPGLQARISYNLGNLHLKDNDIPLARRYFRQAVRTDPGHIYAWTRLARTHERTRQTAMARALYRHAARLAGEDVSALNMIHRQLARMENESDSAEKAREILHDALVRDPSDMASLLLLAQTYIKDDPSMAESLARKCLTLGQSARDVLFEAMAASGKLDKAGKLI